MREKQKAERKEKKMTIANEKKEFEAKDSYLKVE